MSAPRRKTYRPWEPQRYRQEAHSPDTKLPEGDMVFFLLDTVLQLDLSRFYTPYEDETRGVPPFDPAMMVCLLLYAYCVGVFASRKIAQACERHMAFIAIVGQERPDFRTISDFRKLPLEAFREVFVQVLRVAGEAGLVQLGNVATDGTKIQGNASRHKAMSYGYMHKEAERLREELKAARARGRVGGRPKALPTSKQKRAVELYQEKRLAVQEICTMMGISKPTLYAYVRQAQSSS
jgi:transposase